MFSFCGGDTKFGECLLAGEDGSPPDDGDRVLGDGSLVGGDTEVSVCPLAGGGDKLDVCPR